MQIQPDLQPLPYKRRRGTFILLLLIFVASLPFLYFYATGYRFEFGTATNLISSTGGMYIAAERTGAEIFIDDELVRETRVFRRAFYAQSLEPGTHRVHVQKEGHQTWVKELPVLAHLVTEAQAFNLLLVPNVRIISKWQSATGSAVISDFVLHASTTNEYIIPVIGSARTFTENTEYASLRAHFSTTSATSTETLAERVSLQIDGLRPTTSATSVPEKATTTKEWQGVRLYEYGDEVYAMWIGSKEDMPYYYCADEFPRYSTTTEEVTILEGLNTEELVASITEGDELIHPVQTLPEDLVCDPIIWIDRKSQVVKSFDFFPGSTDFVILALQDGIYVVEVDDRAWQNVQPLLFGEDLDMRVQNGQVYVYDGEVIYQVILET